MNSAADSLLGMKIKVRMPNGDEMQTGISIDVQEDFVAITSSLTEDTVFKKPSIWHALTALRNEIEPTGARLLINGARDHAWPATNNLKNLNGGWHVIALFEDRESFDHDRLDLFGYAPQEDVTDYQSQVEEAKRLIEISKNRKTPDGQTRFQIYWHNKGSSFDSEVDTVMHEYIDAVSEKAAREELDRRRKFPTIWSIHEGEDK